MSLGMLGKYEKLDVLGHGVSGIVFLAQDTLLKKHVALKEVNAQGEDRNRVLEEARVLDRLRHPNIVAVNSVDIINGKVVIDMEYVQGSNLLDILRDHEGPLPISEALRIASQLCDGLAYAHAQRTIHRDVKPANILISSESIVKLADFGLAEVLGTNSYAGGAGTFAYMAPEDFDAGERSDRQSDIWAVGVILYEMLTGFRPFNVSNTRDPFAWSRAVSNDEIKPPSYYEAEIPPELDEICLKTLERDKSARYTEAAELGIDLRRIEETLRPPDPPHLDEILIGWGDIEGLLKNAPANWELAADLLADGSLSSWLHSIDEPLLAGVASELQNGSDETVESRLREFLYRAGLEVDLVARQKARAGADLIADSKYPEAVENLQIAVNLDPSKPSYFRLLAQAARGAHDIELAQESLQKALAHHPNDRALHHDLLAIGGATSSADATVPRPFSWFFPALLACALPAALSLIVTLLAAIQRHDHFLLPIGLLSSGMLSTSLLVTIIYQNAAAREKFAAGAGILLIPSGIALIFAVSHTFPSLQRLWPTETLVAAVALIPTAAQITAFCKFQDFLMKWGLWYTLIGVTSVVISILLIFAE